MKFCPSIFLPQMATYLRSQHSWECMVSAKAGVTSACCPMLSENVLGYGHRVPHLRVSDTQVGLCSQQGHSPLRRGLNLLFPHHLQTTCSPLIFIKPAWDPALLTQPSRHPRRGTAKDQTWETWPSNLTLLVLCTCLPIKTNTYRTVCIP